MSSVYPDHCLWPAALCWQLYVVDILYWKLVYEFAIILSTSPDHFSIYLAKYSGNNKSVKFQSDELQ
jgi:hypothetical protein